MEGGFIIRDFNAAEEIFAKDNVTIFEGEVYRCQQGQTGSRDPNRYVGIAASEQPSYTIGNPVPIVVVGGFVIGLAGAYTKQGEFVTAGPDLGELIPVAVPTSVPISGKSDQEAVEDATMWILAAL